VIISPLAVSLHVAGREVQAFNFYYVFIQVNLCIKVTNALAAV
jgi:hypothetical protein